VKEQTGQILQVKLEKKMFYLNKSTEVGYSIYHLKCLKMQTGVFNLCCHLCSKSAIEVIRGIVNFM